MKLCDFIDAEASRILDEWESFARELPAAQGMNSASLRDHANGILHAISDDLHHAQSRSEQTQKAWGKAPHGALETEAEMHGCDRMLGGFSVNDTMAEFRALRASVPRLWTERIEAEGRPDDDIMRFNEAIDQALTESLGRYSAFKDRQARLFGTLLSSSPDLNLIVDPDGTLVYVNKAFASLFATSMGALVGQSVYVLGDGNAADIEFHVRDVVDACTTYSGEMPFTAKDGRRLTYDYVLVPVLDPNGHCEAVACTARDVTERKAAEERARHSANYDQLTDLPNRSLLRERLDHEIKHATRIGLPLALLFIDLDGFKGVNDRLGHAAGDQLLQQVASRINACVRDTDTVARLGGDEFTMILTDITQTPYVETIAGKVLDALKRPFTLHAATVEIFGSIGITVYPQDAATLDELVRNADAAMYAAKHDGRNRYRFFAQSLHARARR